MQFSYFLVWLLMVSLSSCRDLPNSSPSGSTLQGLATCPLGGRVVSRQVSVGGAERLRVRMQPGWGAARKASGLPKAFDRDTTLFGTEVEFPIKEGLPSTQVTYEYLKVVKDRCHQCPESCVQKKGVAIGTFEITDLVRNPQSLSVYVNVDVGVVEVTTTPLTYAETESWQGVLDDLIFGTARNLEGQGLLVNSDHERNRWSGHVNVSWPGLIEARRTTDLESLNLLLSYQVDLENFPELAMGVLGGDIRNATPLAFGTSEEQAKLLNTITAYKQGRINNLFELAESLATVNLVSFGGRYKDPRYRLVNLENIRQVDYRWGKEHGTRIELRGFFSPLNVDDMLANYRIVNSRLEFLRQALPRNERHVMEFKPPKISESYLRQATEKNHKLQGLVGNLAPAAAARSYVTYLSQAKLNPRVESAFIRDPNIKRAVHNLLARCPLGM